MGLFRCSCRNECPLLAVLASIILGVIAAFLQITAVITVTPAFLWVALGIAVVYLAVLEVSVALTRRAEQKLCLCDAINTVLAGILGTALLAVVLLAVGIVATSVVSAILVGVLVAFLALTLAGTACLVRCSADCES